MDPDLLGYLSLIQSLQSQICAALTKAINGDQEDATHIPGERYHLPHPVFWADGGAIKKFKPLRRCIADATALAESPSRRVAERRHVLRILDNIAYASDVADVALKVIRKDYDGVREHRNGGRFIVIHALFGSHIRSFEAEVVRERAKQLPEAFVNRYMAYALGCLQKGLGCIEPILQAEDIPDEIGN